MIELPAQVIAIIEEHARHSYPEECCGALLGRHSPLEVREAWPGRNVAPSRRARRYTLDPRDLVAADRRAAERGLEIVGFYHSHPDGSADPSLEDCRLAWPGYLYLIAATSKQRIADLRAWRFAAHRAPQQLAIDAACARSLKSRP